VSNQSNELLPLRPEPVRFKHAGELVRDLPSTHTATCRQRGRSRDLRRSSLFIVITLLAVLHPHLHAQQMTTQAPPAAGTPLPDVPAQNAGLNAGQKDYPTAVAVPSPGVGDPVEIESATQSEHDKIFVLDGAVVITYRDRVVEADHVEYDANTGEVTATGHLEMSGGPNHEDIKASHGNFNLKTETGKFYDVTGAVGMAPAKPGKARKIYINGAPFLFTGRMVVKTGPQSYDIYDGSVTSCQLPDPDWLLTAAHFSVADGTARGYKSTFHLLNLPLVYLPYVTHPTDPETRQSGFMIPSPGYSSSRGFTLEEQVYLVLNRSMDLLVGASYYSSIGFAQDATFRYRGPGLDFVKFHYTGLLDRRPAAENQGGEDALISLRHDFSPETRLAGNVEYLSSYIYREAFTDNFNDAVTSDIVSTTYLTHETNGMELAGLVDRYQGIKLIAQGTTPQQQVHILHVPTFSFDTTEHRLGNTNLELSLDASASGLKRTQPNLVTGGVVERIDVHPQVALPFSLGDWRFRPSVGMEETAYSRSFTPSTPAQAAQQNFASLSRSDVQFTFAVRAPVLERVFAPTRWTGLLGSELKHTIEPEVTYRLTRGVDDFKNVLRFDATDVVADTNEVEYGVTQRLFRKRAGTKPCAAAVDTASLPNVPDSAEMEGGLNPDPTLSVGNEVGPDATRNSCENDELISWRLTQKYFLDPTFGGAVVNGRRNIFDSTLSLSGAAFLTEPREISPLVSRLRLRTSAHTDVEWDFDIDTGAKKFTSSNLFLDLHASDGFFGALSYARLDAPGRFYTEGESTTSATGVTTQISDFNQLRVLLGFGSPTKPGLSLAANTGLDLKNLYGVTSTVTSTTGVVTTTTVFPPLLQYATVQANYNWNCCGLSIEYRKFELGSVRNEGSYKFNFTLANIGTAGSLRRTERLF
jgi:LPS-assembly protein